jgi:hypothetical protein
LVETRLATIAEFGSPQTGPNGEPNQALLAAQASLRLVTSLGSGSAQANLRFDHLQVRLKQQLVRSKDGNGNCSCRDSDVELPVMEEAPWPILAIDCCVQVAFRLVIRRLVHHSWYEPAGERPSWAGTSYSDETGTRPTEFSYVCKYQLVTHVE